MVCRIYFVFTIYICVGYVCCTCTQPNITQPCVCEQGRNLALHCKGLTDEEVLRDTYSLFAESDFEIFKISDSFLSYIPTYTTIFNNTKSIYVIQSSLEFLFADSPPTGLDSMILDGVTFLYDLNWEYFEDLNLKNIIVRDVEIARLDSEFEESVSRQLEILLLRNTSTCHLEAGIFKNFVFLKDLRIESSEIKKVRRNMFARPAESLEILSFEDNKITFLPKDLFTEMPNLKNVDFSYNYIRTLSVSLFRIINNLEYLSMEGNPLACDCDMKWIARKGISWQVAFSRQIQGVCRSPDKVAGVELRGLTPSDFEHCPKDNTFKLVMKTFNMHVRQLLKSNSILNIN